MSDTSEVTAGNGDLRKSADLAHLIGEVELLVSGAMLFAMLKLPGWLKTHLVPLAERFSDNLSSMVFVMYFYLASGATILAFTFALHMVLRARWIALVGLRRAFPAGVRWKRMRASSNLRAVIRRNDPGAEGVIQRASTRATIVFASGLNIASFVSGFAILAVLALLVAYGSELVGHPVSPMTVFVGIAAVLFLPLLVGAILEKLYEKRLPVRAKLRRALAHVFGFYARIGLMPGFSISRLLQSQGGEGKSAVIGVSVMLAAMFIVAGGFVLQAAPMHFGSYSGFPHFESESRSTHVLYTAQYGDQRAALESSRVPWIQSRVITDPYLELTVPYEPSEDGQAIRSECPDVAKAEQEGRPLAALACLTELHAVSIDNKPLRALRYQVAVDPDSRRPVLLAMIDVRALAPGRHELRVRATEDPEDKESHADEPQGPWVIPFWR